MLAEAWHEPSIRAWTAPPEEPSIDEAARWIEGEAARRRDGLALDLVITRRDRSECVGEVGIVVLDPERGWAEIGYWLLPGARGAGLATEAVDLLSTWALEMAGLTLVFARTPAANLGSRGVLARVGFTRRGTTDDGTEVWTRDLEVGTGGP